MIKKGRFLFLGLLLVSFLLSCASTPSQKESSENFSSQSEKVLLTEKKIENPTSEDSKSRDVEKVILPKADVNLPIKKMEIFQNISTDLLAMVEDASAENLKKVLAALRKKGEQATNDEILLMNIAFSLFEVLYPEESLVVQIPSVSDDSPFLVLINFAKKGIYDEADKREHFFSLTFPSLVLITSPSVTNFYDAAETALAKARMFNGESFLVNYLSGLLAFRKNAFTTAKTYFEKAYRIDSEYFNLNLVYVATLLQEKEYELANSVCQKLLEKNQFHIDVLKYAAEIAFETQNFEHADKYVLQILQREPENMKYVLFRAKLLIQKGDYIKASSLLDLYEKNGEIDKDFLVLKAQIQSQWNKNNTAAILTIQQALSLYPEDEDVLFMAANLSSISGLKIGDFSVLELLEKLLQKDSKNFEAINLYVYEQLQVKNYAKAYDFNQKLLENKKYESVALLHQVKIFLGQNKISDARSSFDSYKKIAQNTDDVLVYEITLLRCENRKSEALAQIEKLLSGANSRLKSALYLEKSYLEDNTEKQLTALRSSLSLNPRNKDALFALYEYYFARKDYRKAQYYLKQVVSLNPNNQFYIELHDSLESLL